MANFTRDIYKLGFEISPIILQNGIAQNMPGSILPIVLLTQPASFVSGVLNGAVNISLDQYFCHFMPLPGSSLISNQIAKYPFANQTIAANAVISTPTNISMMMSCPVNSNNGYLTKLLTITAMKSALDEHNASGGLYIIATPAYIYTNCIMLSMTDVSNGASKQTQQQWRLDFEKPLVTVTDTTQTLNSFMQKVNLGVANNGEWTSFFTSVGSSVSNVAGQVVDSAKNLIGTFAQ